MDVIRQISLLPALHVEARVPRMRAEGRVQVDADADLVVVDAGTVMERATFNRPLLPRAGIRSVLVLGVPVARDGVIQDAVFPGRPIRGPVGT